MLVTAGLTSASDAAATNTETAAPGALTASPGSRGTDTLAVRRGNTYFIKNSLTPGAADITFAYGRADDVVLVGDWNGDGIDTLAVRRGRTYHFKNSLDGGAADAVVVYGRENDTVLVGDWNGDGIDTLAVRRGRTYHFKNSLDGGAADAVVVYGRENDTVLVGDWNGDGIDTLAVRRGRTYLIRNAVSTGIADRVVNYGREDDAVLVGDWDGDAAGSPDDEAAPESPDDDEDSIPVSGPLSFDAAVATVSELGAAWAGSSVNATSFRRSAIVSGTYEGVEFQVASYYSPTGDVMLARRDEGEAEWTVTRTGLTGNVDDAHNVISLGVDGNGTVHLSWGMHSARLRYATSAEGGQGAVREVPMLGTDEAHVTYPEFYTRTDGDLFFLYRNGGSGHGDLVLNRFDAASGAWSRVSTAVISGEGKRSAYWQAALDANDCLHLTWTWRETADVRTNHDVMYAVATDDTATRWQRHDGTPYSLPITAATGDVVVPIPQGSNLINQTGMTVDAAGVPYLATYWEIGGVTQYAVVTPRTGEWTVENTGIRTTMFDLGGIGTRALPLSRPDIAVTGSGDDAVAYLMLRDQERGNAFTIASRRLAGDDAWSLRDVTASSVGRWEPSYDRSAWHRSGELTLYVQQVAQINGDTVAMDSAAPAYVVDLDLGALAR